ncbi:PID-CTERM protein-sorting domain-containing protein [Formosa sp. A9]|uniref:PID-CTERM protein-sorting domain-containing protein n=1 Tax=Formosa sp. A9 TaxID=3442641 RepID=UPI003EBC993B
MMQHKTKIFLILFFFAGVLCFAQETPPTPDGRGPTPPGTPIDGGLVVLLVAGACYGIKKSSKR